MQVGKIKLYLLDTLQRDQRSLEPGDIRPALHRRPEQRLRQEIVPGIGGARILHHLGLDYSVIHLNEGHPAFAILERIRQKVEEGMSYLEAFEQVHKTTVFTTHTPVPAGHDVFSYQTSWTSTLDLIFLSGSVQRRALPPGHEPGQAGGLQYDCICFAGQRLSQCCKRQARLGQPGDVETDLA